MIVKNIEQWERAVKFLLTQDRIAVDTEYVAYGYPDTELTGFSLSWKRNGKWEGLYVPLLHRDPVTMERQPWQLTPEQVAPGLNAVLQRDGVTLGGQNFKVEVQAFSTIGVSTTENVFDTMLVGFLLNTNGYGPEWMVQEGKGKLGLKEMSEWVLGEKQTKLKDLGIPKEPDPRRPGSTIMRVDLAPDLELFAQYAIADTDQTGKLWDEFERRLDAEPRTKQIYWRINREFMFVLADMEMFGVELDVAPLHQMEIDVTKELLDLRLKLYQTRKGQDFLPLRNPTKLKQLAERWNLAETQYAAGKPPLNDKGAPAGKAWWRKRLIEEHGFTGHPVVEKVRDDKLRAELILYPHLAHKVFKIAGDLDLQRIFFEEEGLPSYGKKFMKAELSTSKDVVKIWAKEHGNAMAQILLDWRLRDKLLSTYIRGLPRLAKVSDGRLRGRFNQTGARTGRLSSAEPNQQNQPKNKKYPIRRSYVATGVSSATITVFVWELDRDGKQVRPKYFRVENAGGYYTISEGRVVDWGGENPPWVLFVGDYSQLEIRLLAHMSQDEVLIQSIHDDVDIHALTARDVIAPDLIPADMSLEDVKTNFPMWRDRAKTANFGVVYGMGFSKFARDYGYTDEEAQEIIEGRWMGKFTGVAEWIAFQHDFATRFGYVQTGIGQRRHLPAAMLKFEWPTSRKKLEKMRLEIERGERDPKASVEGNDGRRYKNFEALEKEYEWVKRLNRLKNKAMRQAQNAPIQGYAANVVAIAQRNIRRYLKERGHWGTLARMLLQVHDEVVMEFHPGVANEYMDKSVELMEGVFDLSVPLGVSAALGANWLDTKE